MAILFTLTSLVLYSFLLFLLLSTVYCALSSSDRCFAVLQNDNQDLLNIRFSLDHMSLKIKVYWFQWFQAYDTTPCCFSCTAMSGTYCIYSFVTLGSLFYNFSHTGALSNLSQSHKHCPAARNTHSTLKV